MLRGRALKRLNIIKIFSHRSWQLDSNTLKCIYDASVKILMLNVKCLNCKYNGVSWAKRTNRVQNIKSIKYARRVKFKLI